jgi:hypothetical protein
MKQHEKMNLFFIVKYPLQERMTSLYTDADFQQHKQKLIFQNSSEKYEINNTPLDQQLQCVYDAFDKDDMEIHLNMAEHDNMYKEDWEEFLKIVEKVRNKRKERFNEICMKLKDNPGICYQIKNSDGFCYNQIEGLWFVVRGDVWRSVSPTIIINNDDVCDTDAVFLQFQNIYTYDYKRHLKYGIDGFHNDKIIEQVYNFVKKRYLSIDDITEWLSLIEKGVFGKHFTTIAIVTCKDNASWVPKKYIYYINPMNIQQSDCILEFNDKGKLHAIPLKPAGSTNTPTRKAYLSGALKRTMLLTNEDCEKYCSLVELTDPKPYAFNAFYSKHRTRCYYYSRIYSLEFTEEEYNQYLKNINEIENICVK